jgi:hypothetical protein
VPAALRALLDPDPPTTTRPDHSHPATRTAAPCWPPNWPPSAGPPPGHRNHTLNRTAFKVYRYVASGILQDDDVTTAFTQAAPAIGLSPAEVARMLASARTAGLANPRSIPIPDQEASG